MMNPPVDQSQQQQYPYPYPNYGNQDQDQGNSTSTDPQYDENSGDMNATTDSWSSPEITGGRKPRMQVINYY